MYLNVPVMSPRPPVVEIKSFGGGSYVTPPAPLRPRPPEPAGENRLGAAPRGMQEGPLNRHPAQQFNYFCLLSIHCAFRGIELHLS